MGLRRIPPRDRPREKLERLGPDGVGDNELLAVILGSGCRHADVLAMANQVLHQAGGLRGLLRVGAGQLRRVTGVGAAGAAKVLAAIELGRRTLALDAVDRVRLNSPASVAAYLLPLYGSRAVEHFGILMLDTKHRLIRTAVLSVGSLDSTVVHPREVFREASAACAAASVLFHDHPSGDPTPSHEDLALTTRLMEAGTVMGIAVVDHVILAESRYVSLAEDGSLRSQVRLSGRSNIERL